MYKNAIYIYISWYSKICWFLIKKWRSQQSSRSVSRDLLYFMDLLYVRYNWAKFHHCRICVTDFKEEVLSTLSHPLAALKRPILNSIKIKNIDKQWFSPKSISNLSLKKTKNGLPRPIFRTVTVSVNL